jgi:hypothetical protein
LDEEGAQQLLTRRRVVCGIAATVGATLLGFGSVASAKPGYLTKGFSRARFAPHVGTAVELRPAGGPAVRAKLVAVEDLAGESVRHLAGSQNAYALRFRVPSSLQIGHGMVGVRHPRFGVVGLFVTRSTSMPHHQDYIAVVNRVLH